MGDRRFSCRVMSRTEAMQPAATPPMEEFMAIDVSKLVLTRVAVPDEASTLRQVHELAHEDGVELVPSENYSARDSDGCVRIIVDREARVTHVSVESRWEQKIPASKFGPALFRTYIFALQRVTLLESRRPRIDDRQYSERYSDMGGPSLSLEDFLAKARSDLDEIDESTTLFAERNRVNVRLLRVGSPVRTVA